MTLAFDHILVVLGMLAVAAAIILALQNRRTPQSSAAWVLFIIMLPYVAVPVFLILGVRKRGTRRPELRFAPPGLVPDILPAAAQVFARLGAPLPSQGNRIRLHTTPEEARAALLEVIAGAKERLDVILYVLAPDASGHEFLSLLTEKARQGVQVRLGLDGLGSLTRPRRALRAFRAAGGELQIFAPILDPGRRGQPNLRNHRKLVLADGTHAWTGGRNVGDVYLASPPGVWRDLSLDLRGPAVGPLGDLFASDWAQAGNPAPPLPDPAAADMGSAMVQLVPAGPDERLDVLHDGLVNAIHRARSRIWIATPYFVPTEGLTQALCIAARRGVEVRILIPRRSNQRSTDLARGPYLREAARAGCRIRLFTPGMMHGKAGVIDDAAWIGSANFDVRSMLLNFEMGLMLYDADSLRAVTDWFTRTDQDCIDGPPHASRLRRLAEAVFRLGAPLL